MSALPFLAASLLLLSACAGARKNQQPAPVAPATAIDFDRLFARLVEPEGEGFLSAVDELKAQGAPVVLKLAARFDGANDLVRYRIAWTLADMALDAGDAEYLMKAALRDPLPSVRYCAAYFFGRRTTNPDRATTDVLLGALNNRQHARFRLEALSVLAHAVVPSLEMIAPVFRALEDDDRFVRDQAYRTLQAWAPALDVQEAAAERLSSENRDMQAVAAMLLAQTLDDRAVDLPRLRLGLDSASPLLRAEAARLLARHGAP